jgi:hypothetical protein
MGHNDPIAYLGLAMAGDNAGSGANLIGHNSRLAYLAGHRDMSITKRYVHPQEHRTRRDEKARVALSGRNSGHSPIANTQSLSATVLTYLTLVVRPDRLERPTFWFVATNRRAFIDLAVGTMVVQHCALLRVIKEFRGVRARALAKLRNASTHRVGTKMGTVRKFERGPTATSSFYAAATRRIETLLLPAKAMSCRYISSVCWRASTDRCISTTGKPVEYCTARSQIVLR